MTRRILLMFVLLVGALAITQPTSAQQPTATYSVYLPTIIGGTASPLSAEEQAVLDAINQARALRAASLGSCPPLIFSPQLQEAAHSHSADMAERNFFNHTNPDGVGPFQRANAIGYAGHQIAENIATGYQTPSEVVAAWMESPGHRQNILDCSLTETGIGYVHQANDEANVRRPNGSLGGPYFSYWTQVFGTP